MQLEGSGLRKVSGSFKQLGTSLSGATKCTLFDAMLHVREGFLALRSETYNKKKFVFYTTTAARLHCFMNHKTLLVYTTTFNKPLFLGSSEDFPLDTNQLWSNRILI